MRPPVESYVRSVVEVEATRIECIAGIELRDPSEYLDIHAAAKALMREAIASMDGSHGVANPARLADAVRKRIEERWPDRYWFCEVAWGERDGWCQVFSPPRRTWRLVQEAA